MSKTPKKPRRSVRKPSRLPQIKPSREKQVNPKRKVQETAPVAPEAPVDPKREKIKPLTDPSRRRQYMLDRRKGASLVRVRVTPGDTGAQIAPFKVEVFGAIGPAKEVARDLGGKLSDVGAWSVVTSTSLVSSRNSRRVSKLAPARTGRLNKLGATYRTPNETSGSMKVKVNKLSKVHPSRTVRIEMRLEGVSAKERSSIQSIIEDYA